MVNSQRIWTAEAPSNIALIKYMGKTETVGNRPTNTSLSYTLPHLKSLVQLEYDENFQADTWEPLLAWENATFAPMKLSAKGTTRFLAHLNKLKEYFGFKGHFKVRSSNDFPSDCGLASSASSFAALTKVAMMALADLTERDRLTVYEEAEWSRRGSGSSCRSFFEPWSIWTPDRVTNVPHLDTVGNLLHQVVIVNDNIKAVSSSEAHKRVTTSLLFSGRPERAELRTRDLIDALAADRWADAFEIAWAEFWDMHALFETSQPSFGYMTAGSLEVLRFVRAIWDKTGSGPLVTMDAGPNIHLLFKDNEAGYSAAECIAKEFKGRFPVIANRAELTTFQSGAER
jgi:diphosphomevalonate decarboxylase